MNTKDLIELGVTSGEAIRQGMAFIANYISKGLDRAKLAEEVGAVVRDPAALSLAQWQPRDTLFAGKGTRPR